MLKRQISSILYSSIQKATAATKRELESLIAGEGVSKSIRSELTYRDLDGTVENVWSVLLMTGYLTLKKPADGRTVELIIPNQEIREIFITQIREWFEEQIDDFRKERDGNHMNSKDYALLAAETLDSKKAEDIIIFDIAEKSSIADYLILATGLNERSVGALIDEVEDRLAQEGLLVKSIEGKKESGWILMDYGDIIVNVLTVEKRDRYNIEKVWADCNTLSWEVKENE